ncbi:MAG TPA: thiamine pyrophosphate-dependent dehydrogenase E1 component subunit alpha [Chloroflexota bacterium]
MEATRDQVDRRLDLIGLNADTLRQMYSIMVLARVLDEHTWILNRQGKAHFTITGRGHEAAQVGSVFALRRGRDFFVPYYRDLAVPLALGMTPFQVLLGVLGREGDPFSGSRQLPFHASAPDLRIVSGSSSVASQIPHAAGIALASKLRGEDDVTIVYFGDGATSKGDFHEGINFAAVHRLPVIFFCENNGWAISVPLRKQMVVPDVAARASSYGVAGVTVDGCDLIAVYEATRAAADRARRGEGPTLIDAKTVRLTAHSSDDDETRYRSPEDREEARRRDPLPRTRQQLLQAGLLTEDDDRSIWQQAREAVEAASVAAEATPYPPPADALTHVYAES